MPPPIPLSGAGAWKRSGSQPSAASKSAKRGRIRSQASTGTAQRKTPSRACATNACTSGESTRNSSATRGVGGADEQVVEAFEAKRVCSPQRQIIEPGESVDSEACAAVVPRRAADERPQEPPACIFDAEDADAVDGAADHEPTPPDP